MLTGGANGAILFAHRGSSEPPRENAMNFHQNGLVATLSLSDQRVLRSCCEPIALFKNRPLARVSNDSGSAYFLFGTSVALLKHEGSQTGIAAGLIGQEGAVGLQYGLGMGPSGYTMLVQTDGKAWRVSGELLRRVLSTRPTILMAVARYLWSSTEELGAFAAASQQQPVLRRLATWILKSQGNDAGGALPLTHSHMARMLGVRRASVSLAAEELRSRGMVDYSRGQIQVLDKRGLTAISRLGT
jgi:CRP-like cAMP-binding protein